MNIKDNLVLSAMVTAIRLCKNPEKLKQYRLLLKAAYCIAEIGEVDKKGGGADGADKPEKQ